MRENYPSVKPKTSSIVWKINRSIQFHRLWNFFFYDLLFGCMGVFGICFAMETAYGLPGFQVPRVFAYEKADRWWRTLRSFHYTITYNSKTVVIESGIICSMVLAAVSVVLAIQLLGWLLNWFGQNNRLRKYMRPIDELAMAAEKMASEGIDFASLQNLEEAIDQITASENSINMGDSDLKGLETAINNLLKRLQASYREQTRFVDDASHELRTPIAVIQGYASMLERWGMDDRATLEEGIHAISEESEHMKELVDQLLFLARGDGGRQQFQYEEVNGADLIKEICEESEMIDDKHLYAIKNIQDVIVKADRAMIKQAVRILTDNAAKYTPEGGRITFSAEETPDHKLALSVQDEGIGMDAKEAEHMFERFFRGDEVRGNTKGSGLGLSIAKWIVDRHHGTITVLSYKDMGSRITINIPKYQS